MGLEGGRSFVPGDPPLKRNLAAELLLLLSRSETCVVSWRRHLEPRGPPQAGVEVSSVAREPLRALLSEEMKWERRGSRSRCITQEGIRAHRMEEEAARRGSPTTPLSWSGGTFGIVCGDGRRVPLERQKKKWSAHEDGGLKREARKRRKLEAHQDVRPALTVPVGGVTLSDLVVFSLAAVGPSTTSGSEEGVELAPAVSKPLILRFRLPVEDSVSAAYGRLAKKKKLAMLQSMRDSLLQ